MRHVPLVSIGIPTYNRAIDLQHAIESVQAQEHQNLEIVVSDNASMDGTKDLCLRLQQSDARIRYIRQPTNQGPISNFKAVLAGASGEFFMWLSDDDTIAPNYISACLEALTDDPACTLACGIDRYHGSGQVDREGPGMCLDEATGPQRVLSYYRDVMMNGAFYGLTRRRLLAMVPLCNRLATDWLVVAGLAFLGRIRTLDTTFIRRSFDGQSRDPSAMASAFGLSKFEALNPYMSIASNVWADIGWKADIYAPLGEVGRLTLATRAFWTIVRRRHSLGGAVLNVGRQLVEAGRRTLRNPRPGH